MQDNCLSENDPWLCPPQKVPATAQQILPPFLPPFSPSDETSVAAGQTPISATYAPPTCLWQFITSQQFRRVAMACLLSYASIGTPITPSDRQTAFKIVGKYTNPMDIAQIFLGWSALPPASGLGILKHARPPTGRNQSRKTTRAQ